jgi:acyl-CoA synthetase (AMP-forming)/AMP-acid ligase II
MGLVGCLYVGLYHPGTVTYIGPENFIIKPALWLQAMSRYRAVLSPAPDFAYGMCAEKITDQEMQGVDLSGWRLALNGAEPIDPQTMARFERRFAQWGFRSEAMTPVYGLSEAGLAVTFSDLHGPALITEFDRQALSEEKRAVAGSGRRLVSVGKPLPGVELAVWDENDRPTQTGLVGKIMVKGPSITKGYYNDPQTTEQTIRNGWLDTGDLGFIHDENLYIAGRLKDLIIIRGQNYAPQQVEELMDVEGIRLGCVAAVGHVLEDLGEQLIILAEKDGRTTRPEEELAEAVRAKVVNALALNPYHVQILEPGALPRTASGKLRRSEALRKFLAGELAPPEQMNAFRLLQAVGKSQLAWGRFWFRNRGNR